MALTPHSLLTQGEPIGALPQVFYRLMEAINDPDCSMDAVSKIIGSDISLTTRLLQIANSPFYGFPSKIENISHALNIIGMGQLSSMVLATSVISQFKGIPEEFVTLESFWCHSIACGIAARIIAQIKREPNPEGLYVAGMIHDIGSLIMYKKIPGLAREALTRCNHWGVHLTDAERAVIGFDHAEVGRALAEEWKLPPSLAEIVAYHHNPLGAPNFSRETAMVHIADYLAQESRLGSSGEMLSTHLRPNVWEHIGLQEDERIAITGQTIRSFSETKKLFTN